jgi:hypothetical protein
MEQRSAQRVRIGRDPWVRIVCARDPAWDEQGIKAEGFPRWHDIIRVALGHETSDGLGIPQEWGFWAFRR